MCTKPTPNPLKATLRVEVSERLAAMKQEERERQSAIIVYKVSGNYEKTQESQLPFLLNTHFIKLT